MNRLLASVLGVSTEQNQEEIVLGADQTMATLKDTLKAIEEDDGTLKQTTDEIEELEEVEEALESMAAGLRAVVRAGGMTVAEARVQRATFEHLMQRANMELQHDISLESFSQDPINVTLEAERQVKDKAKAVLERIVEAAKRLMGEMETYIKSFGKVAKDLRNHAEAIKKEVKASTADSTTKVSLSKAATHFHVDGEFKGDVKRALATIISTGESVLKQCGNSKKVVDGLISDAAAGKYTTNDYADSFKKAANSVKDTSLPGGYQLRVDANNRVFLNRSDESVNVDDEITRPSNKELIDICDQVVRVSVFVESCAKTLSDMEAEIVRLVKETEKAKKGSPEAESSFALIGGDLNKILATLRGAAPDYMRYSAMSAKEALNYVKKCLASSAAEGKEE